MANNNQLETADKPAQIKDTPTEVSPVAADSTSKPGEGASTFQKSAVDSQNMVKSGTLPDVTISFEPASDSPKTPPGDGTKLPAKAESREDQVDKLRQVVGDFDINSGIKPENRDKVLGSAVDTANKIAGLPPGSAETKDTFTKAVTDFQKDNPGVDASTFTREMQTVFREMGSKTLSTKLTSNSVLLADTTQVSADNPGGIVASAFTGDQGPAGQKEKTAFETAQTLADAGRKVDFNGEVMNELQFHNFFAGVKDLGPRERPATAQTSEQQLDRLKEGFGTKPDGLFQDVLNKADNLAFNTNGKDLGNRFNENVEELAKNNPSVSKDLLGRMMVEGMRTVTQSKDFSLGTVSSAVQMQFLQDKRLATDANPRGTVGAALIGADDMVASGQEFRDSMETAKLLQQGVGKLGADAKKDDVSKFLIDVRNDLGGLRFR